MIKKLLLLASFFHSFNCHIEAQERVGYEISDYSTQSIGDYDHVISEDEPFLFNWSALKLTYTVPDQPLEGRLEILISPDSIPDANDVILLDTLWSFAGFSYQETQVKHTLAPREYYLLTTFYASDTAHFSPRSNILRKKAQVYSYKMSVTDAHITHLRISEYNEETTLHLNVTHNLSCCPDLLGTFNSQLEVLLSENDQLTADDLSISTFFIEDTLQAGVDEKEYSSNLYGTLQLERYRYLIISRSSAYFTNGYRKVPDHWWAVPLRVVENIEEVNKSKRDKHPFLTYGSFEIPSDTLEKIDVQQLYDEAEEFFELYKNALSAIEVKDYNLALKWTDAAFAYAGSHRYSSLIYTSPDMISDLYSGLSHLSNYDNERETLSFRLGEAMKMSDLMEQAYENLVRKLLPDSLELAGNLDESGFYGNKATFDQELLFQVPVIWKRYSLSALQHFIRVQDYESADLIIQQAGKHMKLYLPLWRMLSGNATMKEAFLYLGGTLVESNDMLDMALTMLEFYTATGLFEEGRNAETLAKLLYDCTDGSYPAEYWKTMAAFAETTGNWNAADSLYGMVDSYYQNLLEKQEKGTSLAGKYWMETQHRNLFGAKTGAVTELSQLEKTFTKYMSSIKNDENALFLYMDLISSRHVSRLAGFLGSSYYPGLYLHNIESLEAQGEYFLASDWKKELAFFLGRDGRYEEALSMYLSLFVIENMKSQAFRLSFSEEAQISYFVLQQEMLSRFMSLLEEMQSVNEPHFDQALEEALKQTLFYHSYILRGTFRMLYDVYQSESPQVQMQYEKWRLLREYLNKLYVEGKTQPDDIHLLKQEIGQTESEMIRLSRDTASFYFDHLPDAEAIRNQLKHGEAAVEIVRYRANHKVYHGGALKYAAFVIRKDSQDVGFVHFPDGEKLETRSYHFYNNAIKYKQPDTLSYGAFWEPLAAHLAGIKKIFWAPDGVFHLINPATLFNRETQSHLLEEIELEVVPTISQISSDEPVELSTAMLLGNPEYVKGERSEEATTAPTTRSSLLQNRLNGLPGTKTEVECIGSLLKDNQIDIHTLMYRDATKQAIFAHNQADLLHFATHGFWMDLLPGVPERHQLYESLSGSGLVLAHAQIPKEDGYQLRPEGILTAAEIQDMYLFKSKLVVLSACETGLGEVVAGEGLYGLKRAFQRAGVENLVTSLWKVDDQVTQQFMVEFYQRLVKTKDLSASFNNTMMAIKAQYPEPYYWGAFVLTCNR
ncbi:hypothetical protein C900_02389 [Fulvivirga imtechensis AK7]|uniref:CHAT domain-containing protein n=1 Tax=Fulvivirga imtechensis AK7 TaxID=1237149 RepID=L8JTT1_9BACT|nr:CHAT domain-containing protein [Fulvivirga imtechensis]ELR71653.1 hypothetical protein C900_02389 [Fulvivirga imtechensis AK7]